MNAYLMHAQDKWYLAFGDDAVEASKGICAISGVPLEGISVSQHVVVREGEAHEITPESYGILFKDHLD